MADTPKIRPDDIHTAQKQAVQKLVPPAVPVTNEPEKTLDEALAEVQSLKSPPPASYDPGDAPTAQIIAKLQSRIEELERRQIQAPVSAPIIRPQEQGPAGFPWQYWKRPDRTRPGSPDPGAGWVVAGPGGAGSTSGRRDIGSYANYISKGETPLTQYGPCPVPGSDPLVTNPRAGGIFRPMLERGGAVEFPPSQILAYGWHVNPPLPGITFPQLDAVQDKVLHFTCPDCDRQTWLLEDDSETMQSCFRHLRTNTGDGRHAYPREEASMYLESLGFPAMAKFAAQAKAKAFAKFLPGQTAPNLQPAADLT